MKFLGCKYWGSHNMFIEAFRGLIFDRKVIGQWTKALNLQHTTPLTRLVPEPKDLGSLWIERYILLSVSRRRTGFKDKQNKVEHSKTQPVNATDGILYQMVGCLNPCRRQSSPGRARHAVPRTGRRYHEQNIQDGRQEVWLSTFFSGHSHSSEKSSD